MIIPNKQGVMFGFMIISEKKADAHKMLPVPK